MENMETFVKRFNIYSYYELSERAKTKAKLEILEDPIIIDNYCNELEVDWASTSIYTFKNSNLNIQYDFSRSQGSGFNIYGSLNLNDVFDFDKLKIRGKFVNINANYPKKYIKKIKEDIKNGFLKESIELKKNLRYTYCVVDQSWISYSCIANIENVEQHEMSKEDQDVYFKLEENVIVPAIEKICSEFYNKGLNTLFDTSDKRMEDLSLLYDRQYLEDGSLYYTNTKY